jgi:hypothetical protein
VAAAARSPAPPQRLASFGCILQFQQQPLILLFLRFQLLLQINDNRFELSDLTAARVFHIQMVHILESEQCCT